MLLATALTVANVGALTPMTALARELEVGWSIEDQTADDPATYVGEEYDVLYYLGDEADDVHMALVEVGGTTANPTYDILNEVTDTLVSEGDIPATEVGKVKYAVYSKEEASQFTEADLTAANLVSTKEVTISSAVTGFTAVPGHSVLYKNGATTSIKATVTVTAPYYNWNAAVYDANDTEYETPVTGFTIGQATPVAAESTETKKVFTVSVGTNSAVIGDYVVRATVADKAVNIPITVVDAVKITDGEYSGHTVQSEDLYPGDILDLNAYFDRTKDSDAVKWATSNSDIATVDESGTVTAVAAGDAKIYVDLGLGDNVESLNDNYKFIINVLAPDFEVMMDEEDPIPVGETAKIKAMYGSTDISKLVEWSSNNNAVATVDDNGIITAVSAGTAVIQAEYDSERRTKTVTVVESAATTPITYAVQPGTARLHTGETLQMKLMAGGEEYSGNVQWEVIQGLNFDDDDNDPGDIATDATISRSGLFKAGTKTTLELHPVTVEATYVNENGDVTTASAVVTVVDNRDYYWEAEVDEEHAEDFTRVSDATYKANLILKDHITVTPIYDGREITNGAWSVDNGTSVRVNNGVITAIAVGDSIVQYGYDLDHSGDIEAAEILTINVTVAAEELVITSEDGIILEEGANLQLGAMFGRDDVTASSRIKWDSDNKAVATVDAKGKVTGKKRGAAEITATYYAVNGETVLDTDTIEIEVITIEEATEAALKATKAANEAAEAANEAAQKADEAAKAADENATADTIAAAKDAAQKAEEAAKKAEDAAKVAEAAAETCVTNTEAAKDAEAAAEAAGEAAKSATTASKTATASATAAQKKIDDAAAKKAEEEKKAAEEAAKKDGSAPGAPAPVGNALKDADGNPTGFEVTNSEAGNAEVAYVGNAADLAKSGTLTIPKTTKDQSGNTYKVTSVKKRALKGAKAKKVVFSENIKDFGEYIVKDSSIKTVVINVKKNAKIKSYKFRKGCFRTGKKLTVKVKSSSKETKATFTKKLDNKKFVIKSKTTWK